MEFETIKSALGDGLLSFPVTDMNVHGDFDPDGFSNRVDWFMKHDISAVFVAGGTGEFFSLSEEEYQQIVQVSVEVVDKKVPVLSSVGRSIPEAIAFAKIAEQAGIDGLLLMPPYLTGCPESGLIAYAKTIMQSTKLPVVYYNRANGILSSQGVAALAEACPNLIALKDGTGNMQELNDTVKTIGDRLTYIGGVPTAEIISEAYLSIGVNTYSSAVFNFVPDLALAFYKALRAGDQAKVKTIITTFFIPFIRLRSKKAGYAVSLIKAGADLIGRPAGNVRAPLEMPNQGEIEELKGLIEKASSLI
ncbi:5-dehydro-4-deoxyglucarate dehydratase [Pareuzebyella sediminis]|uniref:5-dehydro-4-deoxyglucarate dehydratase n=1 Tax=Pareuzebyella sediminis TaxID=2607998 RepID=UPI0011EE9773|nr:5-dehydro-4-deoxyglucarate dehydratase [Pareuzebyella sediminis]